MPFSGSLLRRVLVTTATVGSAYYCIGRYGSTPRTVDKSDSGAVRSLMFTDKAFRFSYFGPQLHLYSYGDEALLDAHEIPELFNQWLSGTRTDDEVISYFKDAAINLARAWPSNWHSSQANAPDKFLELAEQYQREKTALFLCAASASHGLRQDKLDIALECANSLHAKSGHNRNVVKLAELFLDTEEFSSLFATSGKELQSISKMIRLKSTILEAAKWHGLADRDVPVSMLAARRCLSPEERNQFIDNRSAKSAEIYEDYGFENQQAYDLIRQTRVLGAASRTRPLAAQLLDLLDRIAAIGSKPYFKNSDGTVNVTALFKSLDVDIEKNNVFIDAGLKAAVKNRVEKGMLDFALSEHRKENLYLVGSTQQE